MSIANKVLSAPAHQKTLENARLLQTSSRIPAKVSLLVQRQNGKAATDLKTYSQDIIADGEAIRTECKAAMADYCSVIDDVHNQQYTKAIHAMEDLVQNSGEIVAHAKDIETEGAAIKKLAFGSGPFLFLLAVASWLRTRH